MLTAEAQRAQRDEEMRMDGEDRDGRFPEADYPLKDLTERIIGCAIRVHRELGPGYIEGIYENALAHEVQKGGMRISRQVRLPVFYDDLLVGQHRADLIVDGSVVVELKAVSCIVEQHVAQLMSTMKAAGVGVGLLLNFHETRLVDGVKRVVMHHREREVAL